MHSVISLLLAGAVAFVFPFLDQASAHEAAIGLGGKKVQIKTNKGPDRRKFTFHSTRDVFVPADPASNGAWVLVRGVGSSSGKTGMIELDAALWKPLGNPAGSGGYTYKDKAGTRGGVTKVTLKPGQLKISARGPNWPWDVAGPQDAVWVHLRIGAEGGSELESYCAEFGGSVTKNEAGQFKAKNSPDLVSCPASVCGNGEPELGEECDDGNLDDNDGCNSDCTNGPCAGQSYSSTLEAIQSVIFDSPVYSCNSVLCHGSLSPQGGLDLSDAATSHAELVGVPSSGSLLDRVEPGDQSLSFLYEKLAAATLGTPLTGGSPMPSGGAPALTEDHLEAVRLWIRGGAPADLVVAGTAELLDGCLPEPDPLTIPVPDPPANGMQVQQTAWDLPSQSEDEVCLATYYDLTQTSLVPASALVECPRALRSKICDNDENATCQNDSDCPGSTCVTFMVCNNDDSARCADDSDCGVGSCVENNPNNPSNLCFAYHKTGLYQDPQSHHSFVRLYLGEGDRTHPSWGSWTYKFQDQADPQQGDPCDPAAVDPATGFHLGCSSNVKTAVACIGFGPPDLSFGAGGTFTTSATAPVISGSQEPLSEQVFPNGVFSVMPLQGIVVWNSHAFNLTSTDTTMSQYFNVEFAAPADQVNQVQGLFDSSAIFIQNVPPFETREYCRSFTLPQGAQVFELTSHTHRFGVRWRTWAPPNTPCNPSCTPRPDPPIYFSTEYTDPLQLRLDPALALDSPTTADRTFLYCSLYDNGSTPTSPAVKRQSTSPEPPQFFAPGGPCDDDVVACIGGDNHGDLCGGSDANCPGGECDACPVRGGVTTEDEMFILIGSYYIE